MILPSTARLLMAVDREKVKEQKRRCSMRTHSFKVLITSSWDIKTFKPMRIQLHIKNNCEKHTWCDFYSDIVATSY